jgi:hypothetical protein
LLCRVHGICAYGTPSNVPVNDRVEYCYDAVAFARGNRENRVMVDGVESCIRAHW